MQSKHVYFVTLSNVTLVRIALYITIVYVSWLGAMYIYI